MTEDNIDEESLRDLQARAAKLPREIAPPADAWLAIKAEIERPRSIAASGRGAKSVTPVWQRRTVLAAAALVLVAASSAITAIALSRRSVDGVRDTAGQVAADARPVSNEGATPASLAEFTLVENDYISTANRLSALLESDETQLAPGTIAKLKESIRVIDAAILEARRALAADPANKQLIEMLSISYNQKVDLLRRTTEMGRS